VCRKERRSRHDYKELEARSRRGNRFQKRSLRTLITDLHNSVASPFDCVIPPLGVAVLRPTVVLALPFKHCNAQSEIFQAIDTIEEVFFISVETVVAFDSCYVQLNCCVVSLFFSQCISCPAGAQTGRASITEPCCQEDSPGSPSSEHAHHHAAGLE